MHAVKNFKRLKLRPHKPPVLHLADFCPFRLQLLFRLRRPKLSSTCHTSTRLHPMTVRQSRFPSPFIANLRSLVTYRTTSFLSLLGIIFHIQYSYSVGNCHLRVERQCNPFCFLSLHFGTIGNIVTKEQFSHAFRVHQALHTGCPAEVFLSMLKILKSQKR